MNRITTEDCLALNVSALAREGFIADGVRAHGTLSWVMGSYNRRASVGFSTNTVGDVVPTVELTYSVDEQAIRQTLELVRVAQPFGGHRWWFNCPLEATRCGIVYLPPGQTCFASRRAYGLVYASQYESPEIRAIRRADKIRERLGGQSLMSAPFPPKPPRMWTRTYERARERCAEAELDALRLLG